MISAYNHIVGEINSINSTSPQNTKDKELSPPSEECDDACAPFPTQSFSDYFQKKLDMVATNHPGELENTFHKPELFDAVLNVWLPMAPFWPALMLGMTNDITSI